MPPSKPLICLDLSGILWVCALIVVCIFCAPFFWAHSFFQQLREWEKSAPDIDVTSSSQKINYTHFIQNTNNTQSESIWNDAMAFSIGKCFGLDYTMGVKLIQKLLLSQHSTYLVKLFSFRFFSAFFASLPADQFILDFWTHFFTSLDFFLAQSNQMTRWLQFIDVKIKFFLSRSLRNR